jgi:hypothetical protein
VTPTALYSWVQRELAHVLDGRLPTEVGTALAGFTAAVARSGCVAHGAAHRVVQPVVSWLCSPAFAEWVRRRRAESDATAEWLHERRQVLETFVATWRSHPDACDAAEWKTAESTLTDIQKSLRKERQDELTPRLREAVETLLPDSSVDLAHIGHKGGAKRKWGLDVELRIGGRKATLGMLSSGQRNACCSRRCCARAAAPPSGSSSSTTPCTLSTTSGSTCSLKS